MTYEQKRLRRTEVLLLEKYQEGKDQGGWYFCGIRVELFSANAILGMLTMLARKETPCSELLEIAAERGLPTYKSTPYAFPILERRRLGMTAREFGFAGIAFCLGTTLMGLIRFI